MNNMQNIYTDAITPCKQHISQDSSNNELHELRYINIICALPLLPLSFIAMKVCV